MKIIQPLKWNVTYSVINFITRERRHPLVLDDGPSCYHSLLSLIVHLIHSSGREKQRIRKLLLNTDLRLLGEFLNMMNHQRSKRRQDAITTGGSSCSANQQQQQQQQQCRPRNDGSSIHLDMKNDDPKKHDPDEKEDKNNNNIDDNDDSNSMRIPMIPTRDCSRLYCSAATLHCARKQQCIPCAYKIACFDVALDTSFCQAIPNQRPEVCPRNHQHHQQHASSFISSSSINPAERRVVAEMGTLGYQPHYRILTIGDGDFSFSLALAFMLQATQQSNHGNKAASGGLTATSFESKETLEKVYGPEMMQRIQLLESMGVRLLYQVDGTKLTPEIFFTHQQCLNSSPPSPAPPQRFHRIVWNFPCSAIQKGQDGQNQEMEFNKALIRDFVAGAIPLLDDDNGQIHINHKTKPPFDQWQIQDVALAALSGGDNNNNNKVYYWGRVVLDRALFPPYVPRKALHSKSFPVHDACTYIFGRNNNNKKNTPNAHTSRGLDADVVNLDLDDDDDAAHDNMTASAATLVPVTRPLILSLRRHLLQSIIPSREKNARSKSKRNRKKRRTS